MAAQPPSPSSTRAARALPTAPGDRRVSVGSLGSIDGASRRFGPRALPAPPPGQSPPTAVYSPPSITQAASPPPVTVSPVAALPGPTTLATPPPVLQAAAPAPGQVATSPYVPTLAQASPPAPHDVSPPAQPPTYDAYYESPTHRSDIKERIATAVANVQQANGAAAASPPPTAYYQSLSPPQSPPANGADGLAFGNLSIGGQADGLGPPNPPFGQQRAASPLPDHPKYHSNIPFPPPATWNVSSAPIVAPQATAPPPRFDAVLTPPPGQAAETAPQLQQSAPPQAQPGAHVPNHQPLDVYGTAASGSFFPQQQTAQPPQLQQQHAPLGSHLPTPPNSTGVPPALQLPTSPLAPAAPPPTSVTELPSQPGQAGSGPPGHKQAGSYAAAPAQPLMSPPLQPTQPAPQALPPNPYTSPTLQPAHLASPGLSGQPAKALQPVSQAAPQLQAHQVGQVQQPTATGYDPAVATQLVLRYLGQLGYPADQPLTMYLGNGQPVTVYAQPPAPHALPPGVPMAAVAPHASPSAIQQPAQGAYIAQPGHDGQSVPAPAAPTATQSVFTVQPAYAAQMPPYATQPTAQPSQSANAAQPVYAPQAPDGAQPASPPVQAAHAAPPTVPTATEATAASPPTFLTQPVQVDQQAALAAVPSSATAQQFAAPAHDVAQRDATLSPQPQFAAQPWQQLAAPAPAMPAPQPGADAPQPGAVLQQQPGLYAAPAGTAQYAYPTPGQQPGAPPHQPGLLAYQAGAVVQQPGGPQPAAAVAPAAAPPAAYALGAGLQQPGVGQPAAVAAPAAAATAYAAAAVPGQPSFAAPPTAQSPAAPVAFAPAAYNPNLPHNRPLPVIPRIEPALAILPHCVVAETMTLALKDHIFFKVADPTARDVNGNVVFKFSNQKGANKVMIMNDINDNVLYQFDEATSRGLNKAVIRNGQGQELIRIDTMYSATSKFRISFQNVVTGQGVSLSVQGKLWVGLQCQLVMDNGQVVAHIIRDKTKALLLTQEKATYTLSVAPGVDLALITIVVAALNQIDQSRAMNFVNVAAQYIPT